MMAKPPRISILMPVRNEAALLPAALTSLQRQSCTDWELIAIDDGSDDATANILASAATSDCRVQVITQHAAGLVTSLNRGLAACRASLIARMDGDDICHPRRLELQTKFLDQNPETTLVSCRVRHVPRQILRDGMIAYESWQNSLLDHDQICCDLFVESPFVHPSVTFRKNAVLRLGGYREMGWPEDYDLWLRLAQAGARFARLPDCLFYWRDRPERQTRTSPAYSLNAFRACKAHHLCQSFLSGETAVTLWGAGLEGKAWHRVLMTAGIRVKRWIEVDPRKLGQVIHGARVEGIDTLAPGEGPLLVTVGARGARAQIREHASRRGLVEHVDYVCVT